MDLFPVHREAAAPFDARALALRLAELARSGVRVGTSSWKYSGWRGMLYDSARYVYRGRFSESRFENLCLEEYAAVFKTVSVDAAYYRFPEPDYLHRLVSQVPRDFQFGLKVTDAITIKRFPSLPRFGAQAGKQNQEFLNVDLFCSAFLEPCVPFRDQIGLVMFEFSRFSAEDFPRGRDFVLALDHFLGRLPKGWSYGVELRNRSFLHPEYLAMLASHHVTHIFNNWEAMPPVEEQLALPGSRTHPDTVAARFLLRCGRRYEEAVRLFKPYDEVKEISPEGRASGARLIREGVESGGKARTFVFVNNRFEGNALRTIQAMVEQSSQVTVPD
jgi:uncharacterized protein YecE (DUF72 family)